MSPIKEMDPPTPGRLDSTTRRVVWVSNEISLDELRGALINSTVLGFPKRVAS
jgi:hypothetical protein